MAYAIHLVGDGMRTACKRRTAGLPAYATTPDLLRVTCKACVRDRAGDVAERHRARLEAALVTDPALGGVNHRALAYRLYARGVRATKEI